MQPLSKQGKSFHECVFNMRILLSLLLALTVHAQVLDPKKYCPRTPMDGEYFVANNTCYFLSGTTDKNPSWQSAHNDCKHSKGSLLIFKDKSNEDAVVSQIIVTSGFDSHLYWLGISRVGNSWKWTTGATLTYTPSWDTGTGECAVINVETKTWSPRDCSADWYVGYICQYDSTSSSSKVTQDSTSSSSKVTQVLDPKKYCPITPMDGEYFVANNTCYFLSGTTDKNPSWQSAHNDCKHTKGSLLIFKDKSNEDAVVSQIIVTTGFDSHLYWLGINRVGNFWKWTTGATLTYTPSWDTGTGECAVINVGTKTWSPRDCSADWYVGYICQYDSTSSSSRVTQDAVILLTLVLTLYRIFVTDR